MNLAGRAGGKRLHAAAAAAWKISQTLVTYKVGCYLFSTDCSRNTERRQKVEVFLVRCVDIYVYVHSTTCPGAEFIKLTWYQFWFLKFYTFFEQCALATNSKAVCLSLFVHQLFSPLNNTCGLASVSPAIMILSSKKVSHLSFPSLFLTKPSFVLASEQGESQDRCCQCKLMWDLWITAA